MGMYGTVLCCVLTTVLTEIFKKKTTSMKRQRNVERKGNMKGEADEGGGN
jgi:hypothetical protein